MDGNKNAKLAKKHGVGAYKEDLIAMVEVNRVLEADQKEEEMTCFNEMKMREENKLKAKMAAEERKMQVEEKRLEIEERRLALEVEEKKRTIEIEEHRLPLDAEEHRRQEGGRGTCHHVDVR